MDKYFVTIKTRYESKCITVSAQSEEEALEKLKDRIPLYAGKVEVSKA